MNKKQFLYNFINSRTFGVIATVTPDGRPEAAVMEMAVTPELVLIFDTADTTRKYANLKKNPAIAFAFGWEAWDTVQFEGIAEELVGKERGMYRKIFLAKHPDAKKWDSLPETTYFRVVPRWIRYTAMNQKPWVVTF